MHFSIKITLQFANGIRSSQRANDRCICNSNEALIVTHLALTAAYKKGYKHCLSTWYSLPFNGSMAAISISPLISSSLYYQSRCSIHLITHTLMPRTHQTHTGKTLTTKTHSHKRTRENMNRTILPRKLNLRKWDLRILQQFTIRFFISRKSKKMKKSENPKQKTQIENGKPKKKCFPNCTVFRGYDCCFVTSTLSYEFSQLSCDA